MRHAWRRARFVQGNLDKPVCISRASCMLRKYDLAMTSVLPNDFVFQWHLWRARNKQMDITILGARTKMVIWCTAAPQDASDAAFTWGREHPRADGSYETKQLPAVEKGGAVADRRTMFRWRARYFRS